MLYDFVEFVNWKKAAVYPLDKNDKKGRKWVDRGVFIREKQSSLIEFR